MSAIWQLSAAEMARQIRDREVTALEVAEAHIERTLRWNDSIRAFLHFEPEDIRRQARAGVNDRRGVDHVSNSDGAHIISALATTWPSTLARVSNRQTLLMRRCRRTSSVIWSPGSTGFLKRALSMATK